MMVSPLFNTVIVAAPIMAALILERGPPESGIPPSTNATMISMPTVPPVVGLAVFVLNKMITAAKLIPNAAIRKTMILFFSILIPDYLAANGISKLDDPIPGNPDQPGDVQAVVAWFPPTNFLKMDEQLAESGFASPPEFAHSGANSPESLILGQKITEIPDLVHAANPETYLRPRLPPFFIQHGTHADVVPHQQSLNFAAKLAAIAPQMVSHELLSNARHADPAFETSQNVQKVLDFLDLFLRASH